jgi:hypothetical protein
MLYSCIFTAFLVFFSLVNALHNVTYNDNDPAVVYNPAADWLVLSSLNAYVLTYYIGLTGLRLAVYHGNGRSGSLNAPILNFFFWVHRPGGQYTHNAAGSITLKFYGYVSACLMKHTLMLA